jgi:acetylornithine deacetylase
MVVVDSLTVLLSRLVAIPSVNPMGRPLSGPEYLEGRVTDFLDDFFRELGARYQRMPIAPGRENIVAWHDAPGTSRRLLFDVHQDTVPTEGMTIEPFEPTIDGGKLYGRGACDVKGSMAAMLVAFRRLVQEKPKGAASVVLACTVDEEYTHKGSSYLAANPVGADLAIVAEPTRLNLVTTHKGAVRWKIVANGVACHSSTPGLGRNAIYRMGEVVTALAEHAAELAGSPPAAMLGPPSLSIGRIEGGQSVNIVADRCEIEIDRRVIPGETADGARERVRQFLADRLGNLDDLEFLPPWVRMPALAPGVEPSLLDAMAGIVRNVTGRTPEITGVPFGTDAGPLGETGLSAIVFGPGDIAQAHTKDEWIELDQVRMASEAYYRFATELG